jgi:hypothetical protein
MTWFQAHSGAANGGVLAGRLCAHRKKFQIEAITGLDCAPEQRARLQCEKRAKEQTGADSTHRDSVLGVTLDLRQELPCGGVLQAWYRQASSPQQRQHGDDLW